MPVLSNFHEYISNIQIKFKKMYKQTHYDKLHYLYSTVHRNRPGCITHLTFTVQSVSGNFTCVMSRVPEWLRTCA